MLRLQTIFAALVVLTAWFIFLFSFFLPASNVVSGGGASPGTPLTGWETFTSSILLLAGQPLVILAEPKALLFLTFPFINLLMLISPFVALGEHERAPLLALVLVPFGLLPMALPKILTGDVFIGFYAWVGSFFLMSAGCLLLGWAARPVFPDDNELRGEKRLVAPKHG